MTTLNDRYIAAMLSMIDGEIMDTHEQLMPIWKAYFRDALLSVLETLRVAFQESRDFTTLTYSQFDQRFHAPFVQGLLSAKWVRFVSHNLTPESDDTGKSYWTRSSPLTQKTLERRCARTAMTH